MMSAELQLEKDILDIRYHNYRLLIPEIRTFLNYAVTDTLLNEARDFGFNDAIVNGLEDDQGLGRSVVYNNISIGDDGKTIALNEQMKSRLQDEDLRCALGNMLGNMAAQFGMHIFEFSDRFKTNPAIYSLIRQAFPSFVMNPLVVPKTLTPEGLQQDLKSYNNSLLRAEIETMDVYARGLALKNKTKFWPSIEAALVLTAGLEQDSHTSETIVYDQIEYDGRKVVLKEHMRLRDITDQDLNDVIASVVTGKKTDTIKYTLSTNETQAFFDDLLEARNLLEQTPHGLALMAQTVDSLEHHTSWQMQNAMRSWSQESSRAQDIGQYIQAPTTNMMVLSLLKEWGDVDVPALNAFVHDQVLDREYMGVIVEDLSSVKRFIARNIAAVCKKLSLTSAFKLASNFVARKTDDLVLDAANKHIAYIRQPFVFDAFEDSLIADRALAEDFSKDEPRVDIL